MAGAQVHPLQQLIEAARKGDQAQLQKLLASGLPGLQGRDGAAVWGAEFLFAVESEKPATVAIDHEPAVSMTNIPGTKYWYRLMTLRLGTTHNYNYFADGRSLGTYDVAGYNPDSYPQAGVARGTLSAMKTLRSQVYPGMSANYWVYVNPGADLTDGAPLMVRTSSDSAVLGELMPPMMPIPEREAV